MGSSTSDLRKFGSSLQCLPGGQAQNGYITVTRYHSDILEIGYIPPSFIRFTTIVGPLACGRGTGWSIILETLGVVVIGPGWTVEKIADKQYHPPETHGPMTVLTSNCVDSGFLGHSLFPFLFLSHLLSHLAPFS